MPQSDTPRVGFQRYDPNESWEYNTDFELLDDTARISLLDSGTVTLSGGATPAHNSTIAGVSTDQTIGMQVVVGVDADPAFNADYAFNYEWTHAWDDSDGQVDVELTVNWDTDPGSGNDVTASYRVYEE